MTVTPDKAARAARAGEALMARHAELREVLGHWAGVLATAADSGGPVRPARSLLRAFLADEVLPHARAEERTLYRVARRDPEAGLLVRALVSEHRDLAAMTGKLGEPARPAAVAAQAAAISALFASHAAKEDSLLLPAPSAPGRTWPPSWPGRPAWQAAGTRHDPLSLTTTASSAPLPERVRASTPAPGR